MSDTLTADEIITRAYASEFHFNIRARWDAGFEWDLLKHEDLSVEASGHAESIQAAARELARALATRYPWSAFARWWVTITPP